MQVLEHLKLVDFTVLNGYKVSFDENGDTAAKYDLLNWQYKEDDSMNVINIGHYDNSLPEGQRFSLTPNTAIIWALNSTEVKYNRTKNISVTSGMILFLQLTLRFYYFLMSVLASKVCLPGCMPCRKSQGR